MTMNPLPFALYERCRKTLLQCDAFQNDSYLRTVFITTELHELRDELPEANNRKQRVERCIDYLTTRKCTDGKSALPVFLNRLCDKYDEGDALHGELESVAIEVEAVLLTLSVENLSMPSVSRAELRRKMATGFNLSDLENLCFDMEIDYQSLRGEDKESKTRELISYCERNGRVNELVKNCRELRPNVDW